MDEKQIAKQLKTFNKIQADKPWVFSLKQGLLAQDTPFYQQEKSIFILTDMNRILKERVSFAVGLAAFIGIIFIAGSLSFDWFGIFQNQQNKQITLSLQEMQDKLEVVGSALDNLKNLEDKNQALAMAEVVKATVKENQKIAQRLQTSPIGLSKKTLASLGEFEKESGKVAEKSADVQKEIFEQCFNDLRQRSLNIVDSEQLRNAEEFYKQGNIAEAMVLLQQIGQ